MGPDLWHSGLYRLRPGLARGWILSQDLQVLGRAFDVFGFQPFAGGGYFDRNREEEPGQAPDTIDEISQKENSRRVLSESRVRVFLMGSRPIALAVLGQKTPNPVGLLPFPRKL